MTSQEFRHSLKESETSADLPPLLRALWWDAKGDWNRAHEIAQDVETRDGAWVHAYLHRKEGDATNAGYWYRQAGKPHCTSNTEAEWCAIVDYLLR
jgi:uncharacterized cupin superfamily protein